MLIKSLNIALPAVNLFSLALLQYHILVKILILPLETCCQVLLGFSKTPVEVQSTWRTRIPSTKMVVLIRCKPWSVPGHIFAPEARTFSCFLEFSLNLFVVWLLSSFQIILSISCMHVSFCLQQDRVQVNNGVLTISSLNLADIGMFQCVAENKHGRIFANAELRVVGKTNDRKLFICLN